MTHSQHVEITKPLRGFLYYKIFKGTALKSALAGKKKWSRGCVLVYAVSLSGNKGLVSNTLNQAHLILGKILKELHPLDSQLSDTAWRILNESEPFEKYLQHPVGPNEIDVSVLPSHNVFH